MAVRHMSRFFQFDKAENRSNSITNFLAIEKSATTLNMAVGKACLTLCGNIQFF
ncbi:hypothetical protein [Microbulbifer sp. DLAB2-AA]|uniref:hypothetical protein n=1 Tax=unclassified Microbulbifer TaxID=2619833 RepID=UPI00403AEA72